MTVRHGSSSWGFLALLVLVLGLSIQLPRRWEAIAGRALAPQSRPGNLFAAKFGLTDTSGSADWSEAAEDDPAALVCEGEFCEAPGEDETFDEWCISDAADLTPSEIAAHGMNSGNAGISDSDAPATELASRPDRSPQTHFMTEGELAPRMSLSTPPLETPLPEAPPVGSHRFGWVQPRALLQRLERIAADARFGPWAKSTAGVLSEIAALGEPATSEVRTALKRLRRLAIDTPEPFSSLAASDPLAIELRLVRHEVVRRLEIWEAAAAAQQSVLTARVPSATDAERLALCLAGVEALTTNGDSGRLWREYLLLESLKGLAREEKLDGANENRLLARRVIGRLDPARLAAAQQHFTTTGSLASLATELRPWAAEPLEVEELLANIEQYEQTHQSSDARQIARDLARLEWVATPEALRLRQEVEDLYTAANLRVVISGELLERFVPRQHPESSPINTTILGIPVRGRSLTTTDLAVRLVPDEHRLRMALEASGLVTSRTLGRRSPVTIRSASRSEYVARKSIDIFPRGMRSLPAEVSVNSRIRLNGIESDFDGIPLVAPLVRSLARRQHDNERPRARRQVESRVVTEVAHRVDTAADARLAELNRRIERQILAPMGRLSLEPRFLSMQTTAERLTARIRLSGAEQLGAHTPRPQAPAASLASLQVHESALNNLVEQFALAGETFRPSELIDRVRTTFNLPAEADSPNHRDDVQFTFAKVDPVQIRCDDGLVKITLSVSEVEAENRAWRNITVRAFYRPDRESPGAQLARDRPVQLTGQRLSSGGQIALRGIFSRVFPRHRRFSLVPTSLVDDPRSSDLAVTQFVIRDGWIGVALGKKASLAAAVARR